MTSTEKKSPDADAAASAAEQAGPASGRSADFGIDTTAKTTGEAIRAYATNLRSGDLGALPALLGLLALFILFTALASDTFPSLLNLANLLQQGAGQTVIAMGLVFVLLTGEIDLAAGTASGLTAAVMALHLVSNGNLLGAMGTTVFVLFAVLLAVAVALGVLLRIWSGAVFAALALLLLVVGFPPNPWLEMLLAVCTGVAIGILTGFLVARIGMPSFVVTLALFIAWQGVILQLIGDGGTLGLRDPVINAVANGNLSTLGSWILFVVAAGGYAAVLLNRQFSRRKLGLVAQPTGLVLIKIGAVVLLAAIATFLLTLNRSLGATADRGRALRRADRAGAARRGHLRARPHPVRPARLRGRRQPGGGAPRGHQRRPDPGHGVRDLLGVRGDRRDHLLVEGRLGLADRRWRQHAAVRRRRGGDRRHLALRRARPDQQRRHRWRGAGDGQQRAGPARAARLGRVPRQRHRAAARRGRRRAVAAAIGRSGAVNRAWGADGGGPGSSTAGARPDEARRHNRAALLRRLHVDGPCTRATLATELGLNRSTIKAVVDGLAESGVVTEAVPARAPAPGGRR